MTPSSASAVLPRIRECMARRDYAAARPLLMQLANDPGTRAWAHERLAFTYVEQGRHREAMPHLAAALAGPWAGAELPAAIASLCAQLHRMRDVAELCRHPMVLASDNAMVRASIGHSAMAAGDYALAAMHFQRAAELGNARAHVARGLGIALGFLGDAAGAERQLETSLGQQPYLSHTHWSLAKLRRQTSDHNHVERLRARLAMPGVDDGEIANVGYALFKELDDLGRPDEAWPALLAGSQAMRRTLRFDRATARADFDALLGVGAPDEPARGATPTATAQPLFIVGLPRSGTTLVDRIVSGHSQVASAGELNDFPWLLRLMCGLPGAMTPDAALVAATAQLDFDDLGRRYLEDTAWRAAGRPFYTDKLPHNFMNIGWIRRALPQARILHLVRNPMDVCWSNLKELFVGGYDYSNDLDDLAEHYHGYRQLMAHWHACFPGAILDVDYDRLVADPEPWARRILDFCGLPFEPHCLRIEDNAAPVATASAAQVREGIHRRASGQWARYRDYLQPLQARLQAFGYVGPDGEPLA